MILICCVYVLWRGPNRRLWWWKKNDPDMPEGIEGGNKKLHPSQETFYSEPGTIRTTSDKPMATTTPQDTFSRDGSAVLPIRKSSLFTIKQARKVAAAVNQNTPPVPTYRPTSSGPVSPNPRHTKDFRDSSIPAGPLPPGAAPPSPSGGARAPSRGSQSLNAPGQRSSSVPSRRSVTSPVSGISDFGAMPGSPSYQTYPPPLPSPPPAFAPMMTKTPPPGATSPPLRASATMPPPGAAAYPVGSSPPVSPHLSARPLSHQRVVSPSGSSVYSNGMLSPAPPSPQSSVSGHAASQRLSGQQLPYSHPQTLNALAGNTLSPHLATGTAASRHANRLSSRSAKSATSITPSPLAQSMTGKDLGQDDDVYASEFGAAIDSRRNQHRSVTYVPHPEQAARVPTTYPSSSPPRPLMRGGEAI